MSDHEYPISADHAGHLSIALTSALRAYADALQAEVEAAEVDVTNPDALAARAGDLRRPSHVRELADELEGEANRAVVDIFSGWLRDRQSRAREMAMHAASVKRFGAGGS